MPVELLSYLNVMCVCVYTYDICDRPMNMSAEAKGLSCSLTDLFIGNSLSLDPELAIPWLDWLASASQCSSYLCPSQCWDCSHTQQFYIGTESLTQALISVQQKFPFRGTQQEKVWEQLLPDLDHCMAPGSTVCALSLFTHP